MKRFTIVILIIIGLVAVVGLTYIFRPGQHKAYTTTSPKQPEKGGDQPISLLNGDKLAAPLLQEQYYATRDAIFEYTVKTYGDSVKTVKIAADPVVQPNGDLVFTVVVTDKNQSFDVRVSQPTFDTMVFSVPKTGYNKTLNVYQAEE